MNLSKKTAAQICKYYDDLEQNVRNLGPEMSEGLQRDQLYARVIQGIALHEKKKFAFRKVIGMAAAVLAFIMLSIAGYYQFNSLGAVQKTVQMQHAIAAKGRVIQLTLGDGTQIWVNSGSKLDYPATFAQDRREVILTGEAYFQVAHDSKRPFLIRTSKLTTQVLGTSFNIRAYPEDGNIQVAVLTGKVGVSLTTSSGHNDEPVFLTPNQRLSYNKLSQLFSVDTIAKAERMISWREGHLQYDAVAINTVVADIQRKYDVKIKVSPLLGKRRVTVDFNNESIKKVMIVLSEVTGARVVKTEQGYSLTQ